MMKINHTLLVLLLILSIQVIQTHNKKKYHKKKHSKHLKQVEQEKKEESSHADDSSESKVEAGQSHEQQHHIQQQIESQQDNEQQHKNGKKEEEKNEIKELQKLTPLSKYQAVEVVDNISSYSKVDLVDKKKASERKQFYQWNEDSYKKMTETPTIQGHIIYESTTRSSTPIIMNDINPLWDQTSSPIMAPVQFPTKPMPQQYPSQGVQFQSVLKTRVPIRAQYRDAPDHLSAISTPIQAQGFYSQNSQLIIPDHIQHNPNHLNIDSLINGMNQEMVTYKTKKLLRK